MKDQLRQFERSAGGKLNRLLRHFKPIRRAGVEPIDFPAPDGLPNLSIIVSVEESVVQIASCLRAVREHTTGHDFEVLAVGDDSILDLLHNWKNIQSVPVGKALTFGEPANRAVQKARGEYLVFLHSSVTVRPGWREALLEPLRSMPEAGLVGVEAGVLNRDGSLKIVEIAEPGPLREADFCTTTCLAVSKNLFLQAGGFDGFYLPMEEANLALKIRQARHRILVQPGCPITRGEAGRRIDPNRMESNRTKFVQRWAEVLAHHG